MQAIILAAGMGKRLRDLTENNTKCMVSVNGETIIERMLRQIDEIGLNKIIIVVGYCGTELKRYIKTLNVKTKITYIENNDYETTNNIFSLWKAKEHLIKDDTLLFESDVVFENNILKQIISDKHDAIALVDKYRPWMDGTCIKMDTTGRITDVISKKDFNYNETDGYYKTVNIYKFSKRFSKRFYVPFLEAYIKSFGQNEYYEQVLRIVSSLDRTDLYAINIDGMKWYEIDDIQDLNIAETIFAKKEETVESYGKRFGGYWRFDKITDFSYLVNPYFPVEKMMDEMKASFDNLLCSYPSGMDINSMLAAKMFAIHKDHVIVGNGASELIKLIMDDASRNDKKIGIISPSFDEYKNRCKKENTVIMTEDLEKGYTEKHIMSFFKNKGIDMLIIVNPDNPTGTYIKKNGLIKLIQWCDKNKIELYVDESFVDFADEAGATLIDEELLLKYKGLRVIKSISKSYGVAGIRLGIMASGDKKYISEKKKEIAIWNINSFAEYFMQIYGKYEDIYKTALSRFKEERKRFYKALKNIDNIKVYPSQANYFMIKIDKKVDLAKMLIEKHGILIKPLEKKLGGGYYRVAILNKEKNILLEKAIKSCLK